MLYRFVDRRDAGRRLAIRLAPLVDPERSVVLGLPRGGVPVAYEIATGLGAPLDVLLVRKLGVPWQPELAFGAISSGGVTIYDDHVLAASDLAPREIEEVTDRERRELDRREHLYRGDRPPLDVTGRTAVVVDDGIATGSTMLAALAALAKRDAARRVVACPVAPPDVVELVRREADEVVCLVAPSALGAIGLWYEDFTTVTDEEVLRLLGRSHAEDLEG